MVIDYADQRYYANSYGRFNTADPYAASGGPSDPSSWNRYSYTGGDPVNRRDPSGREWIPTVSGWCSTLDPDGGCYQGGGGGDSAMLQLCQENPFVCVADLQAAGCSDAGINAFLGGEDSPIQIAAGCSTGGAPIIPVATTAPPPVPTCSLEVDSFPLRTLGFGPDLHGPLYFTSNLYGGLEDVIEGYAEGNLLQVDVSPGNSGIIGNVAGTGTDDGVVSGPQVCSALGILESDASKINGVGITYNNLGPNSSSALRYMLQSLNSLLGSSWFSVPVTMLNTGYYTLLPGLESPPRRVPFGLSDVLTRGVPGRVTRRQVIGVLCCDVVGSVACTSEDRRARATLQGYANEHNLAIMSLVVVDKPGGSELSGHTAEGAAAGRVVLRDRPYSIAASPDGEWIGWDNRNARPWPEGSGAQAEVTLANATAPARRIGLKSGFSGFVALSSKAKYVALMNRDENQNAQLRLVTIETSTAQVETDVTPLVSGFPLSQIIRLGLSDSGSRLVAGSAQRFVVIDLASHKTLLAACV